LNRKSIYIEGLDGAVIRDVLIFNTPNKAIPDETSSTQWNLTARVYLDKASNTETGTLSITRVGSGVTMKVPVTFATNDYPEFQDMTLIIPVSEVLGLND